MSFSESERKVVELCSIMEGEVFGESAIFTEKTVAKVVCDRPSAIVKIHR